MARKIIVKTVGDEGNLEEPGYKGCDGMALLEEKETWIRPGLSKQLRKKIIAHEQEHHRQHARLMVAAKRQGLSSDEAARRWNESDDVRREFEADKMAKIRRFGSAGAKEMSAGEQNLWIHREKKWGIKPRLKSNRRLKWKLNG